MAHMLRVVRSSSRVHNLGCGRVTTKTATEPMEIASWRDLLDDARFYRGYDAATEAGTRLIVCTNCLSTYTITRLVEIEERVAKRAAFKAANPTTPSFEIDCREHGRVGITSLRSASGYGHTGDPGVDDVIRLTCGDVFYRSHEREGYAHRDHAERKDTLGEWTFDPVMSVETVERD